MGVDGADGEVMTGMAGDADRGDAIVAIVLMVFIRPLSVDWDQGGNANGRMSAWSYQRSNSRDR